MVTGVEAGRGCGCIWDGGMGSKRGWVEVGCGESGVVGGDMGGWLSCAGWKCTGVDGWVIGDEGGRLIVTGGDPLRR